MRSRKQRLHATICIFFGLVALVYVFGGVGEGPEGEGALQSVAASRRLLAEGRTYDVYAFEENSQRKCLLNSYCIPFEKCQERCNDDKDCPGFIINSNTPNTPVHGALCEVILPPNSTLFGNLSNSAPYLLFRKPGAPCILDDQVRVDGMPGRVVGVTEDDIFFAPLIAPAMIRKSPIKDTMRISNVGEYTCDPDPEESRMYPSEVFTKDQLKNGAFLLHGVGILYMFFGLAIVCDDYFVPALEAITVKLQLSDDVAGATFMAAGGSAPELFTSVIGVFIAQSDVGFGTIIGSAVFNVLFVIGACSLATRELAKDIGGLPLTWWPLARDSTFYLVDLVLLMVFFTDKKIEWYESLILLCLYGLYVIFMSRNVQVYGAVRGFLDKRSGKVAPETKNRRNTLLEKGEAGSGMASERQRARSNSTGKILTKQLSQKLADKQDAEKSSQDNTPRKDEEEEDEDEGWAPWPLPSEGVLKWILLFPLNFPLWLSLPSGETCGAEKDMFDREHKVKILADRLQERGLAEKNTPTLPALGTLLENAAELCPSYDEELRAEGDEEKDAVEVIKDLIEGFKDGSSSGHVQAASFLGWKSESGHADPASYAKELRAEKGKLFGKYFIFGFLLSIAWIGCFTYLMVWWAETIGDTLGISEVVMGITVLAAGTSVPDLISSVIVARDGKGDMAVSSSIGSNIFDATFGLPLPWFLFSIIHGGEPIEVKAKALGSSVLMLVAMLVSVIAMIAALGWRLNVMLGGLSLINYSIFVTVTVLMSFEKIPTAF